MADMIDRDALKKSICAECVKFGDCIANEEGCILMRNIDAQPTVDAVKHGEWKSNATMERTPFAWNWYCSECGTKTKVCGKYCPNCGAQMNQSKKSTSCDGANTTNEVSMEDNEDDGKEGDSNGQD